MEENEILNLRDMVADEVEYKGLDDDVVDKAMHYIRNSNRQR